MNDDATLVCSVCEKVLETEEDRQRGRCAACTPVCSACGCELRGRWELDHGMCIACGESTGTTAMVDPRPRMPCRGCGHHELIRAILRERAPLVVVAYVCRGCALTELYASGLTEIPIGAEHGTYLIDVR
jgi:hypothetical protein